MGNCPLECTRNKRLEFPDYQVIFLLIPHSIPA